MFKGPAVLTNYKEYISGARTLEDPDETWCVKAAAITRSQARMGTETKLLKVTKITNQ